MGVNGIIGGSSDEEFVFHEESGCTEVLGFDVAGGFCRDVVCNVSNTISPK